MRKILSSFRPRRDGGVSAPYYSTPAGSSVHLPDAVKQSYANDQLPQQIRRGSLRGTEEPEIVDTKDLEADDIVIAVMGPTGSGKSTFVCAASGRDIKAVGHNLRSFTSDVSAVKFWDQESRQHIVLVDTPGFDDTYKSDFDILNLISEWLVSSYNKKKLLSGILYLHRITDNRVAGSSLKNLQVFRKLCGRDALDKVYLTTTMWDEVEESVGKRRLDELKTEYWKTMIAQGAQVARCRSDDDSSKKLIRDIIRSEYPGIDVPYGGPPAQPPHVDYRQTSSSSSQGKPRGSRKGTLIDQPHAENRQGPASHSQDKSQRYDDARGGTPVSQPTAENKDTSPSVPEGPGKNDAAHPGPPVHQLPPTRDGQETSLHPEGRQRYDVPRKGITTPQPSPAARNTQGPSQQRSQEYDVMQPLAENEQGASPQPQDAEKQIHMGREPAQTAQRGAIQVPEEPEIVDTNGQEIVDAFVVSSSRGPETKLLIQEEMAELKKELKETAAGQQLYSQLETLVEKQLQLLRRIDKERKGALDPEILQELQTEYDELRAQIDERLRQMQQLKLPWLRRFFTRR